MEKNNKSLLISILGGAIACFVCVAMIFIFPSKGNNNLKGNKTSIQEIKLGDTTCSWNAGSWGTYQCGTGGSTTSEPTGTPSSSSATYTQYDNINDSYGCKQALANHDDCNSCYRTRIWTANCTETNVCHYRLLANACQSVTVTCGENNTYKTLEDCKSHISCGTDYQVKEDGSGCELKSGKIRCDAGTYYAGQGACSSGCPENYWCPGGVFNVADQNVGANPCDTGQTSPANSISENACVNATTEVSCSNGLVLHENERCTVPQKQRCRGGSGSSWSTSAITCSFNTCAAIECESTEVTYTCNVVYNAATNKVTISATASNSSQITKTTINGVETSSYTPTSSGNYTATAYFQDGGTCSGTVNVPAPSVELKSLDGGGNAYVTPSVCKKFIVHPIGSDDKVMSDVTWKVSSDVVPYEDNCSSGNCIVEVCGWGCSAGSCKLPTGTVTVTATQNITGKTASTTINVTSYGEWRESAWNKPLPSGGKIYTTTALDDGVCTAYGGYLSSTKTYAHKYDRCCCSGGTTTDNPTYDYCCVNKTTGDYKALTGQSSIKCPDPYVLDESKNATNCSPSTVEKIPHCYLDGDREPHWTSNPETSWRLVDGVTKEEDCKKEEEPACYLSPENEYKWGLYAKKDGYKLITSIITAEECHKPEEGEACYKNADGDYKWAKEAPEGYTKVEDIKTPEDCAPPENPACYLHGNEFKWGYFARTKGYILIKDVTKEEDCKVPDTDACYKAPNGQYVWGKYGNDSSYTLIPSVTEPAKCKVDVPVPGTATNVSKLIYVFMAILMACGIGFIYYSSVIKKSNQ